jgi:PAS domain S-box-containing protein
LELLTDAQSVDTLAVFGFAPEVYAGVVTIRDTIVTSIFIIASILYVRARSTDGRIIFLSTVLTLGGVAIPSTVLASAPTELVFLSDVVYLIAAAGFIMLLFLMPDGRFYPKFARPIAIFCLVATFIVYGLSIFFPVLGWPENSVFPFVFLWLAVGLVIQVLRYRNFYEPTKKQQTKWIITGFLLIFIGLLGMNLIDIPIAAALGEDAAEIIYNLHLISIFGVVPALSLPLTFGISGLQYRLWDLGYLLRRLLRVIASLGVIAGILGFGFYLSSTLGLMTLGFIDSVSILILVSILVLFLNPLHQRLQNIVILRRDVVSDEVVDDFMDQLRTTVDPVKIAEKVENRIHDLFEPSNQAFFEFSSGTGPIYLSSKGMPKEDAIAIIRRNDVGYSLHRKIVMLLEDPKGQAIVIPLTSYSPKGEIVTGALYIGPRESGVGYSTEEINQIRDIADQAGSSLQVSRLAQALSETESRYKSLVVTSPDAIIESDLQGTITFVNPNLTDILGYHSTEIVGKQLFDFVALEQREFARDELKLEKVADPDYASPPFDVMKKDGSVFPAQVGASVIDDEEGRPRGYILVIRDLTGQRQYESSLKEARDRALFYLDLMGHDIRNQLQALELAGQIAVDIARKSEDKKALSEVGKAIENCQKIITKVEATEEFLTTKLTDIDIVPILNDTIKEALGMYPELEIRKRINVKQAIIHGNEYFRNVILNLMENAVEHNPSPTKKVWLEFDKKDDGYLLQVKDDGPGMDEIRKRDLFDMRRRFGGVGLHQCREIVTRFNGIIQVEDRIEGAPDKGTAFVVWIPKVK